MNFSSAQDNMVNSNRILYTPSAFAKNNLLFLQEIGTLQALKIHTSRRLGMNSYLFFYIKSGSGVLEYEGTTYQLKKGDCVFLDCNHNYSHRTSSDLWSLQWVHFYGNNADKIHEQFRERNNAPVFHPDYINAYEKTLTELQETAAGESLVRDMMIAEKIMGLLALIMHDCEQQEAEKVTSSKVGLLKDIKAYLEIHFRDSISLDDLAGLFYIDKYYLTRRFKQQYGCTVNTYLQQLRITHAKHLLRFSDRSIEEIALDCGVNDPNYFARLFKKVEGISPGEFRRSWRSID